MKMVFDAEFDREVDPKLHYLCPGGYEVTFKAHEPICFDFKSHNGTINEMNKKIVHFECDDLECVSDDEDAVEDETTYITKHINDIIGFGEFFIYTGEMNEPEIHLMKIRSLLIEVPKNAVSQHAEHSDMFTIEEAGDILFCTATNKLLKNIVLADSRG